ncbi:MAG: hypothetical protein HC902_14335 [Calothrix sp. SM1_5_4]|nr:hypothetical protein [Calothrix sp. SM1_5_4]
MQKPFELSRAEFEARFPDIKEDAGRSFWRVRELVGQLESTAKALRELDVEKEKEKEKEKRASTPAGRWLVLAGVLSHYVGDLAQPLHVSENYDGQMTGQKGIHSYFEDTCVDELFPKIQSRVDNLARDRWPAFRKKNGGKSLLELLEALARGSIRNVEPLLKIDKKNKRDNLKASCARYEQMIADRLVEGSLVLAEIYRRNVGWKYDGKKFYFFEGAPEYIRPGG